MKNLDWGLRLGIFLGLVGIYYPIFLDAFNGKITLTGFEAFCATVALGVIGTIIIEKLLSEKCRT